MTVAVNEALTVLVDETILHVWVQRVSVGFVWTRGAAPGDNELRTPVISIHGLADREGLQWIRGHHDPSSPVVQAMRAAFALAQLDQGGWW